MMIDYKKIGERILNLRKQNNITQEYLAEQAGLTSVQIGNIENARCKPSINALICISKTLKVSTDEILFGSIQHGKDRFYNDYVDLMLDCNAEERQVIIEVANATKNAIKKAKK